MNTTVWVELEREKYPVFCGAGLLRGKDGNEFAKLAGGSVVVVSDRRVWSLYGNAVQRLFAKNGADLGEPILLPAGESHKTWERAGKIVQGFAKRGLRRDGAVVALGGGVVGDVAGFAAAVYMRGVRVLQIPTTLLAQVDAAIGGKTGVNLPQGKNLAGAFHQPQAVLCDVNFLDSLSDRDYRAGLAEVVKYALLCDAEFFDWLSANAKKLLARDEESVLYAVSRSVQHKATLVAADAHEKSGQRALLNLGHTFAHALEAAMGYGKWLHGEAVAVGLVAAAELSFVHSKSFLPEDTMRIEKLLSALKLPIRFPHEATTEDMSEKMLMDKKHTTKKTRFVVLDKIGAARQLPLDIKWARSVMNTLR